MFTPLFARTRILLLFSFPKVLDPGFHFLFRFPLTAKSLQSIFQSPKRFGMIHILGSPIGDVRYALNDGNHSFRFAPAADADYALVSVSPLRRHAIDFGAGRKTPGPVGDLPFGPLRMFVDNISDHTPIAFFNLLRLRCYLDAPWLFSELVLGTAIFQIAHCPPRLERKYKDLPLGSHWGQSSQLPFCVTWMGRSRWLRSRTQMS